MQTSRYSRFQIESALAVARLIDRAGNDTETARLTYAHATTDGKQSKQNLASGQDLLIEAGLLSEVDGRVLPNDDLSILCKIPPQEAVALLDCLLSTYPEPDNDERNSFAFLPHAASGDWRTADVYREELGALGEEHVLNACRAELEELGRPDLSEQTQRVSLVSDSLGYDIFAPNLQGPGRRLEVKTQGGRPREAFRFFLSRNEYEVGRRDGNWAIVCCELAVEGVRIVGWCRALALTPYLPVDRNGRWTESLVHLPVTVLHAGLPDGV
ncbi:DUF3883 domain-containing protein [Micromonospora sp. NPDC047527]|uniref:protein NO VEIN domain-containing protein n=1 Tax=Micromonospora sp. NPDC047527 TaxID=3155144 RepID=UPI0033E0D577